MSFSSGTGVRTWAFNPAHHPHCCDMSCLWRTGAAGDSPSWAWKPLSPTVSADAVKWLLARGLQAAGWRHGQSTHPAGSFWMVLRREVRELPPGSSRCGQANPNTTLLWFIWNLFSWCLKLYDIASWSQQWKMSPISCLTRICSCDLDKVNGFKYSEEKAVVIFYGTNIHLFWLWLG